MNDYQQSRDEEWIRLMQRHSHTNHQFLTVTTDELIASMDYTLRLKDMPSMVDIVSSLYVFSSKIKSLFTVALLGECADEIFGGYRWFYKPFRTFPWIHSIERKEGLLRAKWRELLNLRNYVNEYFRQSLHKMPTFSDNRTENELQQLFLLNQQYFMQTLLERKDRMTMGTGLEVRVSFADHRIVEYDWNIPWEMKNTDRLEKGILRRSSNSIVPKEILYRKKIRIPRHMIQGIRKYF